jgi:hypothetical protein
VKPLDHRHPRVLAILLSSLTDRLPAPATQRSNPLSTRQPSLSSWAPSGYADCDTCGATGTVKRGKHKLECRKCNGRGCFPVDAYDTSGRPLEVANGEIDVMAAIRQLCDMTLPELDRALNRIAARAAGIEDDRPPRPPRAWEQQIVEAFGLLPGPFRGELRVWLLPVGSPADPMMVEVGLAMLGEYLPASFHAPRQVREQAAAIVEAEARAARRPRVDRAGRDAMIRAMALNGRSLRQIAAHVSMTPEGVRKVLHRQEREAA